MRFSLLASSLALVGLAAAIPRPYESKDNVEARQTRAIRIMPFGASIVEITCWRAYLWQKLQAAGKTNIDFVGSGAGPSSCTLNGTPVPFDNNHEGHSGALATQYAANGNLTGWLAAAAPVDIIVIHLGTNDVVNRIPAADTIKAYDTLLGQMRASNAGMKIVVSTLIPIDPKLFGADVSAGITTFNNALKTWVAEKGLVLVDNNSGFDYASMTTEGEHPNEAGSVFMAEHFFPAVKAQIEAL